LAAFTLSGTCGSCSGGERIILDVTTAAAVPAPAIGHGLLVFLAVGGLFFGGKFSERLKKRYLQAA
jgi:hypothetical protein